MKMNKKGFTLAELLIVIAIIAILIAIAIPAFSAQLENARLQADHANLRSAYAACQTYNLLDNKPTGTGNFVYCTNGEFQYGGTNAVTIQSSKHNHAEAGSSCANCVVNCTDFKATNKIQITGAAAGSYEVKPLA